MSNLLHEWLTAQEAAEYLQCAVPTIYQLHRSGKLRAAKMTGSRHLRFRKEWIDEWLNKSAKLPRYRVPA